MPILGNFPGGGGSGGGGLQLAPVTDIDTLAAAGKVYVKWTDPDDLVVAGSTLAAWAGTILVRKAGSAPISRRDGVIVLDSKTKNAYKDSYFCDSGLTDGVTYYYKLFPYSSTGTYTDSDDSAFAVTPNPVLLGDVSGITTAVAGNGKMSIKWTDPAATVVDDGVTLATWASTIVVVKEGSYATSPTDPDAAFAYTSTTRNGHVSTPLVATGLTNGKTYYVTLFPMSTDGAANTNVANRKTGVANRITISNVPSQSGALTYNGNSQSPTWSNYNSTQLTLGGTTNGTNATSYNATFTPKDDYMWSDGSTEAKSVSWSIGRATIATDPGKNGSLTYNGSAQSPTWTGYDSAKMIIGGDTSKTNAGNYTATFTPNSNYQWSDGSTGAKNVAWSIAKLSIATPTANTTSFTYSGNGQMPTFTYSSAYITMGGTTAAQVNANTYTTTFTLKDVNNTQWGDGTTAAKSITWTVAKLTITAPTANTTSFTYSGSGQIPTFSYDSTYVTMSGTTSAQTTAGSYTTTFSLKSTANTQWSGGTTTAKSISWTINKAGGSLTLSTSSVTLNSSNLTAAVTVTRPGDGTVTASSSNTGVATVSVSGTTVTIHNVNQTTGTATITINVAAGTNYTAPSSKTVSVTAQFMPAKKTLNNQTWAEIRQVSDAGQAANYWSVGDVKTININGKAGNYTFSNLSVDVFILGFNHNSSREGNNRIHFQIGKIGGKDVALCDSGYSKEQTSAGYFHMNTSRTNSGGWNNSVMRKTVLGNSSSPTSPLANSLMAALPSDLRAVMKSVTKYTDNTGGGSDTASYVTATADYLFLLAEFEVFGSRSYANSAEKNYQLQYDYYKNGNAKIAYNHSANSTAVWWWLRSPYYITSSSFCRVNYNGTIYHTNASWSGGVRPGFSV